MTPDYEQAGFWRTFFETLNKSPLGLAIWSGVFDDEEICSFLVHEGETPLEAEQRHNRKLRAMLEALNSIESPDLIFLIKSIKQQLKL